MSEDDRFELFGGPTETLAAEAVFGFHKEHERWPLWTEGVPSFGWQTRERWVGFADWMKANGLLKPDVDASAAFTNRYVEAAK